MTITTSFLSTLVLALTTSLQTKVEPPPKEPEEPFRVYVYTEAPGDPDDGDSVGRTTEEVAKRIKDRKKWFRLVESRDEADIAVEVLDQSQEEFDSVTFVPKVEGTDGSGAGLAMFADVKEQQTLATRVHVPKADPVPMAATAKGRRPKDAAKPYAIRLEQFVRQNYWTLMSALEK